MKIPIKGPLKDNINNLSRKIGYHFQRANKGPDGDDELEFLRVMSPTGYPRFHLFLKADGENFVFNLHLDQKRPVYKGTAAHAGEYEGQTVEQEGERIRKIICGE